MSLPLPLAVRVGDRHITQQVQSLAFRKEAVGGVRSITFNLARSLTDLNGLDPLAKVYVYDTRNASTVAQARFADPGRTADSNGQRWDCVAFGPTQHAADVTQPRVFIERGLSDGWQQVEPGPPWPSAGSSQRPNAGATASQGVLGQFGSGESIVPDSRTVYRYNRIWQTGQQLAYIGANWVAGMTDPLWQVEMITGYDGSFSTVAAGTGATMVGASQGAAVDTHFLYGHNTVALRLRWVGAPTTTGNDTWAFWQDVVIEAVRMNKAGVPISAGYTGGTTADKIVADILGSGFMPQVDSANATIATNATNISQLSYPSGVTAEQILADMMRLEPAYRWYTGPDITGNGYQFRWEPWPTTVRYEATLDDGGNFPLSTQDLYNRVSVSWVDQSGAQRMTYASGAVPILDKNGLFRRAFIDLGSELGSDAQATAAGVNFLAQHKVPKNSGSLTIARPIRDVILGCDVQPWEIEAGELVRIRGVEAYPDALNTGAYDGASVFRIYAVDYNSEGNAASLSLDADPHTTEDALVTLLNDRKNNSSGRLSRSGSGW